MTPERAPRPVGAFDGPGQRRAVAESHRRLPRLNALSDIKALIAVLFVAIMMGTVLQYRPHYPWYLTPLVILAPFLIIFLNS